MELLFLALLSSAAAFLLRKPDGKIPPPAPVPYRLALPRDAELSASGSAALVPSLRAGVLDLQAEVRSRDGRIECRLYVQEAFEASMRGLLAAHFPAARLGQADPGSENTYLFLPFRPVPLAGPQDPPSDATRGETTSVRRSSRSVVCLPAFANRSDRFY